MRMLTLPSSALLANVRTATISDTRRSLLPSSAVAPELPSGALDVRVGRGTLGTAVAQALRFRFEGAGDLASRTIVGETDAAKQLLAGVKGAAVRDALHGVLEVLGRRGQPVTLSGLTMSNNSDAFIGNLLISDVEEKASRGMRISAREMQKTADELSHSGLEDAFGVYDGAGWMHLNPEESSEFVERIAAGPNAPVKQGELLPTLIHELEHSVTPAQDDDFSRVPWLEEAQAELLTQWKGAVAEMAAGSHIQQISSGVVAYRPQVEELTKWIVRTGLDPENSADLSKARDLLQGASLGAEPGRIAAAIVQHEGRGDVKQLTRQIERAFAEDAFGQLPG